MESRLIEYFLRVSELGSINKAAADLSLSQPALSRHIALLEHEMGTTLLNRTRSGVHLTEAGKLLADRARPLLQQLSMLKSQVGESASGQIAIGIPAAWQQVFTAPFVERAIHQLPGVMLRVHEGASHVLRDHLFAGLLDHCILPLEVMPAQGYRQTPLVKEPLVLVGPASARLKANEAVLISHLAGERLILPGRPNVLRAKVEHALGRKRLAFRLSVETDTLTLCVDLARRGLGYTVAPACSLHSHGLGKDISWAPIRSLHMIWALCENEARGHSQVVREGRKLVLASVSDALATKRWFGAEAAAPKS